MRRWVVSCLCLSLILSGCAKRNKAYRPSTQELRLNLHSEPPTIDPRKATDATSISVLKMCFEGLTRIAPNGQPILAAAEKVVISDDQKHFVFTLREAKWSDGQPVTAFDFEKTWKTMLDPNFPCEFAIDLYLLKNGRAAKSKRVSSDEIGVKAIDDKTLQVDLEHPTPYFLLALATHAFFPTPNHIVGVYPNWTESHYIGNGCFALKEWRHHNSILIEKNPHYWDRDNVKLERIFLTVVEDESTELTMFENGELDWAGYPMSALPTEAMPSLKQKGALELYPIAGIYYYMFNTKQFPFTNVNIRRAFALAINREEIVVNVTQMGQPPAMALIPPLMWQDSRPYFKDNDIIEAKRLFALGLEELGITLKEFPEVTLGYNTSAGHHKIAQAIQEQWRFAFGTQVKLVNKEWKVFLDDLKHHKFQIARLGGLANINDPTNFLDSYRYLSSSGNHSQWTNPQFSDLLEKADQTADAHQRFALLKEAEKILMQEMPIAPIYFYTGAYLKKDYVKGVQPSELNDIDFKWATVDVNAVPR